MKYPRATLVPRSVGAWGPGKRHHFTFTPEQIKTIKRLHREGEKVAAIARATGLSRPTVYSVLKEAL